MQSKVKHHELEVTLKIGKGGITENVVKQVKTQLYKKRVIKVRFLASTIKNNKKELVKELVEKTNAKVIHRVGFIVVLERVK